MSADQAKPAAAPAAASEKGEKPLKHKKTLPTNCAQCNKRIRRKTWYYLNQKYFCGPNCAKAHMKKLQDEKAKKAADAAAAAAAPKAEAASEEPKAA
jgi:hypothetical protein